MTYEQVGNLFERIKHNYNTFTYNSEKLKEWYKVLKNFDNEEINNNFDKYIENNEQAPIIFSLIRGLQKKELNQEDKTDYMKCEYCGKMMMIVNKNIDEFLEHERKCQKIDFINRIVKQYKNVTINKVVYYNMTDDELENNYRKVMTFYLSNKDKSNNSFIKRIEE